MAEETMKTGVTRVLVTLVGVPFPSLPAVVEEFRVLAGREPTDTMG